MDITVFEITNPDALDNVPEFREFSERMIENYPYLGAEAEDALEEFGALITLPGVHVLAAAEGTELKAMAILMNSSDQFSPIPQVAHFYNEGRPKVKRELIDRISATVRDWGYDKFWAVNATDKADSVWARAFHRAGKAHKIGSIMEFKTT